MEKLEEKLTGILHNTLHCFIRLSKGEERKLKFFVVIFFVSTYYCRVHEVCNFIHLLHYPILISWAPVLLLGGIINLEILWWAKYLQGAQSLCKSASQSRFLRSTLTHLDSVDVEMDPSIFIFNKPLGWLWCRLTGIVPRTAVIWWGIQTNKQLQ